MAQRQHEAEEMFLETTKRLRTCTHHKEGDAKAVNWLLRDIDDMGSPRIAGIRIQNMMCCRTQRPDCETGGVVIRQRVPGCNMGPGYHKRKVNFDRQTAEHE